MFCRVVFVQYPITREIVQLRGPQDEIKLGDLCARD